MKDDYGVLQVERSLFKLSTHFTSLRTFRVGARASMNFLLKPKWLRHYGPVSKLKVENKVHKFDKHADQRVLLNALSKTLNTIYLISYQRYTVIAQSIIFIPATLL